ncbi:MAG: DNA repair protein RecN [Gemmatimonadota bacterium]|nr:DNA repair protein RecN [Gemmatimonadota bacterium]
MLCRLLVVNYALIDRIEVEFGPGLNIITGETGAGKSILIGALGLVLGMRASPELVRTREKRCLVEAIIRLRPDHRCLRLLDAMGIDADQGELIIRREVVANGRSRSFVNGLAVPLRSLLDLAGALVDLHGQHDHQSLLYTDRHIDFLDGFAGLGARRESVGAAHRRLSELLERQENADAEAQRARERRELLEFQVEEIASADPEPDEDERLLLEQSLLTHAERLIETAMHLESLLYQGDDSIVDRLGAAEQLLKDAVRMDETLGHQADELAGQRYAIEELARFFADYARDVEHNPERLAEVTGRLDLLAHLKKKYGGSLQTVLEYRENAEEELAQSERLDRSLAEIEGEIDGARANLADLCAGLSKAREAAARDLSRETTDALGDLGIPRAEFHVELIREESPDGWVSLEGRQYRAGPKGIERVAFHISTNPGEALRPLVKVASGGEISRIMLALKSVLSQSDPVQVLIFDEIDIGISGRIADVVGRKLKSLSRARQTICITHLPQIARMADTHLAVYKDESNGRTVTRVIHLGDEDRARELAKLLGGEKISAVTMEHARELLSQN